MDPLSIKPVTSTATTPQPTAAASTVLADQPAKTNATTKPVEVKRKEAAPQPGTDTPPRDSRSVQYMVQDNRVITTIVDDNSKKVVVQIPDAELIRIAKSIDRMQGFFIEQKA